MNTDIDEILTDAFRKHWGHCPIADAMPDLFEPERKEARTARDAAICRLRADGVSLKILANAFDLSESGVSSVTVRRRA